MNNKQSPDSSAGAFLTAVLDVQNKPWPQAKGTPHIAPSLVYIEEMDPLTMQCNQKTLEAQRVVCYVTLCNNRISQM